MRRRLMTMLAAGMLAAGLTGCAIGQAHYADLDRAATAEDVWPGDPAGDNAADQRYEADTLRFVGTFEDARFFLARGLADPVCVFIIRPKDFIGSGCSGHPATSSGGSGMTTISVRVVSDGTPPDPGWTVVSDNVHAKSEAEQVTEPVQ
ncbi:hypothetical protein [Plantibacter sp. YIM 135347]|uniref:hypothetical protein n=1 Tax=Plantibacter sp. YIM 135347 TaxID=3423919 RepID=UPI003D32D271